MDAAHWQTVNLTHLNQTISLTIFCYHDLVEMTILIAKHQTVTPYLYQCLRLQHG